MDFYQISQKHWGTVGYQVSEAVLEVLNFGSEVSKINVAHSINSKDQNPIKATNLD